MVGHQPQRLGQGLVGMDRDRVDHHPGLEFLDLADLVRLLLDRHVAMNDADAAGLGQRDRERAFGDRVHRRRDQRDAELDLAGEARAGIGIAGQHRRGRRNQHHVVECQRLADFHASLSSDDGALYTSAPRSKAMGSDIGAPQRLRAPEEALAMTYVSADSQRLLSANLCARWR